MRGLFGKGLSSFIVMAGIGAASAADLPARVYSKAPALVPVMSYNWTGCYIGGNVGGIWERNNTTISLIDPTGLDAAAFPAGAIPNSYSYNRSSWLGGGQVGCNYQMTNWVVGIETDFDGTNLRGGQNINTAVAGFLPDTTYVTQKTEWIGTTRARLGFLATDTVLIYGTAGVAYAQVSDAYFLSNVNFNSLGFDRATLVGWTAGGGVEVGFGQWSVKGEALYYDLGNNTVNRACALTNGAPCATPNTILPARFENKGVMARLGLNYHFNAPVFAKY